MDRQKAPRDMAYMTEPSMTDEELGQLRTAAQDMARRQDWPQLLAIESSLRRDQLYWIDVWAPLLAVAARHVGAAGARAYLDEAVAGGFSQPEVLDGNLEGQFGSDPDWADVVAAMAANVPPPSLELIAWPELSLAHPVRLAEIAAERRDALRERLPPSQPSAWDTAKELLRWVSARWIHSGTIHVEWKDALHVLDRVEGGERFACREYTIVLSQALNAQGIPARSVALMRKQHHAGYGRAHAVSEAWIDDLRRWVVLDGQNSMYWVGGNGQPLDAAELRHRCVAGEPPAEIVKVGSSSSMPEAWWPYFYTVNPTGAMISPWPYPPLLERTLVVEFEQLRRSMAGLHPDLLELGVGIVDIAGQPAIQPVTRHPYALGFAVSRGADQWRLRLADEPWLIPRDAGEHLATISTITSYGVHGPHELRYTAR